MTKRPDVVLASDKEKLQRDLAQAIQQRDALISEVARISQDIADIDAAMDKIKVR